MCTFLAHGLNKQTKHIPPNPTNEKQQNIRSLSSNMSSSAGILYNKYRPSSMYANMNAKVISVAPLDSEKKIYGSFGRSRLLLGYAKIRAPHPLQARG